MLKKFSRLTAGLPFFQKLRPSRELVTIGARQFLLRPITNNDIKALLDLERIVYAGEVPWTRSAFLSELYSPQPHQYLCLEAEEAIIAFVGCRVSALDAHITNIAVLPSYQSQGIGSFLLRRMEGFARSQECRTMSLEVRFSNKEAQRLYRKEGYVSRAIKQNYYDQSNEDALDMVKNLDE